MGGLRTEGPGREVGEWNETPETEDSPKIHQRRNLDGLFWGEGGDQVTFH